MDRRKQCDEETPLLSTEIKDHRNNNRSFKFAAAIIFSIPILSLLLWQTGILKVCQVKKNGVLRSGTTKGSVNFLALGDWGRHGNFNQSLIAEQMGKIGEELAIDFVISTGDNFYKNGLEDENDEGFEESFSQVYTASSLQKPWYAVLGNHDYHGDALLQLGSALTKRDWRWHGIRDAQALYQLDSPSLSPSPSPSAPSLELFFIDTVPFVDEYWKEGQKHSFDWRGLLPREQHLHTKLQNLTAALNSSTATWKIVVGHHTLRSYGNHGDTAEMVQRFLPIFEAYNVDVYINGHDHCLEHIKRSDSEIHFITSGGGSKAWKGIQPANNENGLQFYYDGQGFTSFSISATWLQITYYDIDGRILHQLDIPKNNIL